MACERRCTGQDFFAGLRGLECGSKRDSDGTAQIEAEPIKRSARVRKPTSKKASNDTAQIEAEPVKRSTRLRRPTSKAVNSDLPLSRNAAPPGNAAPPRQPPTRLRLECSTRYNERFNERLRGPKSAKAGVKRKDAMSLEAPPSAAKRAK